MEILLPVLFLGILGAIFGASLAVASNRLAVTQDHRLEKIAGLLPGSNCGACGGAGCFGFAEKLLSGELDLSACRVSEAKAKRLIAGILGKEFQERSAEVAALFCQGGAKVRERFIYAGRQECFSANLLLGGQKECGWGCLGFGDCVSACPFGAISMSPQGLPDIDRKKCKACNKCVQACPKKLFRLIPAAASVRIACLSCDSAKDTHKYCSVGCIACGKCMEACPVRAIEVVDNLARIDYTGVPSGLEPGVPCGTESRPSTPVSSSRLRRRDKCTSCGECVSVCPVKCILEEK
jgi:Na+-translocating ferredoxin:NAD+ oxidoreductase RNF subunit RnfB